MTNGMVGGFIEFEVVRRRGMVWRQAVTTPNAARFDLAWFDLVGLTWTRLDWVGLGLVLPQRRRAHRGQNDE